MRVGTPPGPHVRIVGEEDLRRVLPYPLRGLAVGGGEGGTRGVVEETCRILSIRFLPRRRVSVAPFCGHGLRLDRRSKSPRPSGRPWLRRCAICGRTGCRRLYLFRTFRIFLRSDMKTSVAPTTSRTSSLYFFSFLFLETSTTVRFVRFQPSSTHGRIGCETGSVRVCSHRTSFQIPGRKGKDANRRFGSSSPSTGGAGGRGRGTWCAHVFVCVHNAPGRAGAGRVRGTWCGSRVVELAARNREEDETEDSWMVACRTSGTATARQFTSSSCAEIANQNEYRGGGGRKDLRRELSTPVTQSAEREGRAKGVVARGR